MMSKFGDPLCTQCTCLPQLCFELSHWSYFFKIILPIYLIIIIPRLQCSSQKTGEDESRTNVRCADYTAMAQHGEMDRAAADREDASLQMSWSAKKSLWERQERLMQEDRDNQRSLLERLSRLPYRQYKPILSVPVSLCKSANKDNTMSV